MDKRPAVGVLRRRARSGGVGWMQLRDRIDSAPSAATGPGRWTKQRLEDVLGLPLMVPDPLVTATQAATLLGVGS